MIVAGSRVLDALRVRPFRGKIGLALGLCQPGPGPMSQSWDGT